MEARLFRAALLLAALFCSLGASARTPNFIVQAATPELAHEVAEAAERYRRDLAIEWLGQELPRWRSPCPIRVRVGRIGAGGVTSFTFVQGRPTDWEMSIQGSRERVLDSVLPHEITHTIFATHFGRPLPRWADEGACTTVEHSVEKQKHERMLVEFLTTGRGIAFNRMFAMKEYPQDILPLYAQGFSLARFLIQQGGRRKFIAYVGDGMKWNNWTRATRDHYGYVSLSELQVTWVDWVRRGYPPVTGPARTDVAARGSDNGPLVRVAARDEAPLRMAPVDRATPPARSWYDRGGTRSTSRPTGPAEATDAPAPATPWKEPAWRLEAPRAMARPQPPQTTEQMELDRYGRPLPKTRWR